MNIRRGLFRFWFVFTILWCLPFGYLSFDSFYCEKSWQGNAEFWLGQMEESSTFFEKFAKMESDAKLPIDSSNRVIIDDIEDFLEKQKSYKKEKKRYKENFDSAEVHFKESVKERDICSDNFGVYIKLFFVPFVLFILYFISLWILKGFREK